MTNKPDAEFITIWEDIIGKSGVDIFAMQDSVGALNVSGARTLRLNYLEHYISLFHALCLDKKVHFWWNVETFEQTQGFPH